LKEAAPGERKPFWLDSRTNKKELDP
jgi:hypothetical protein